MLIYTRFTCSVRRRLPNPTNTKWIPIVALTYRDSSGECEHYSLVNFSRNVSQMSPFSGRILMETKIPPVVIPMWITGFDQLMPEGRPFPYKYFPRVPAKLSVTFGQPVQTDELRQALENTERRQSLDPTVTENRSERLVGWLGEEAKRRYPNDVEFDEVYDSLIRQKVTAIIQRDVEALGRLVSGDSLCLRS